MIENRRRQKNPGPDFLCIGMQKAGTGFFYECLQNLQAFNLPLRKEIHHFDKHGVLHPGGLGLLRKIAHKLDIHTENPDDLHGRIQNLQVRWPLKKRIRISGRRVTLDRLNVDALKAFSRYVQKGGGDQEYLDIFTPFEGYLSGDVTPAYSMLDEDEIERVHRLLPQTRIILCVREPVARLWSQLNMRARKDLKNRHDRQPTNSDLDEFEALLSVDRLSELVQRDNFVKRSHATATYDKWRRAYGDSGLLVINFEDLTRKTGPVLDKVAEFLDAAPQADKTLPANKKETSLKIRLDDERRRVLEAALGDEIDRYDKLFSHHRDRV